MKNNVWLCLALLACAAPFSSKATDAGPFGPAATDNCNTGAVSVPNTLLARREAGSEAVFPNAQELVVCAAPTVSASGPVLFCPGSSVILSSSALYNNRWSTGDTSQTILVTTAGTYKVRTATPSCTSAYSAVVSVSFSGSVAASGPVTGLTNVYQNTRVNCSVPVITGATSYAWTYSGAGVTFSGTDRNVVITYGADATSGTLSVSGVSACSSGQAASVAINVTPTQNLITHSSNSLNGLYGNISIIGNPLVNLNGDLQVVGELSIASGATLITNCFTVSGGTFTLDSGANLRMCNLEGISATGNTGAIQSDVRNFSNGASYEYNGLNHQQTGTGLPAKVRNLIINNPDGVTLTAAGSITDRMAMSQGYFDLNHKKLTLISSAARTARVSEIHSDYGFINAENFTVQNWLNPAGQRPGLAGAYYFLGAAVKGTTVDSYNTTNNPYVANTYYTGNHGSSVWLFNNSDNTYPINKGFVTPLAATDSAQPGKGLRVWFRGGFFDTEPVTTQTGYPVTGDYNIPVSYCSNGTCADNSPANGWNLIANPYASPID